MRNKVMPAVFVVLLCFGFNFGQTAADVESKYGKPQPVYSVGERLWMTPDYAADGQVCLMRIYPKRVAPGVNYHGDSLDVGEVLKVVNELIPPKTRGGRRDFFGTSILGGGTIWTAFSYERVTFTFISSFRLERAPDWPPSDSFPLDAASEEEMAEWRRKEAARPDDELIRERAGKPEVLEIRWAGRRCVGP